MRTFTDSSECRSGLCCPTCRATTPHGYIFRERYGRAFALPVIMDAAHPDIFACPHEVGMNATTGKKTPMPLAAKQSCCGGTPTEFVPVGRE